jgi:hypothetical protein
MKLMMLLLNRLNSNGKGLMDGSRGCESTTALLRALGQLQQLGSVQLWLHVSLESAAVQQLRRMLEQLPPSWLVDCCEVYPYFLAMHDC